MRVAHIIPAFFNSIECEAVEKTFPEAETFSTVNQPEIEWSCSELKAGLKYRAKLLSEIHGIYDVVILSGGAMSSTKGLENDKRVQQLFSGTYAKGGICAAICWGVSVFGLCLPMKGIHVTCFPLVWAVQILKSAGAIVHEEPVISDQRIVTARDQMCSWMWVRTTRRLADKMFGRYK